MSDFPRISIGKLLDDGVILAVQDGNHGEIHPTAADYVDSGIPFVMANNLNGNQLDIAGCKFITESTATELRKGFAKTGDVLLTHKGSLGLTDVVGAVDVPFLMLTPQVTYYRPNREALDPYFLKYVFQSPFFQGQMFSHSRDGTRPYIGITAQRDLEILLPEIHVQSGIATVLKTYDDLIATNQRRIALLEDAARRLYREWFVHLCFPGHESVPVKDGMPQGWQFKPLGDSASLNYGKALKATDRKDGKIPVYGSSGIVGTHNAALVESGAIVVGRKGNVGSLFFSSVPCFPIDTVFYIVPTQASYRLFLALHQLNFISSDAAVPGLNRSYAHSLPVLQPSDIVSVTFENLVQPVFEQVQLLTKQNAYISRARDLLLPKLMSGQLDVSGIPLPDEMAA